MKEKLLGGLLLLNAISFSNGNNIKHEDKIKENDNNEKSLEHNKLKERGIEKLNFYIPVKEQNKYSSNIEIDLRPYEDKISVYKLTFAEGYLSLNQKWDFNYKIEKEYYIEKDKSKKNKSTWENEFSLVRFNKNRTLFKTNITNGTVLGLKHDEIKISKENKNS